MMETKTNNRNETSIHLNHQNGSRATDSLLIDEDTGDQLKEGHASLLSCFMILLNTVTGAGMLGLPAAMAGSGFVGGGIIMIFASFFSGMGLYLLSLSAITSSGNSFYSVSRAAFQWDKSTIFIDFIVAIKCFGVATSFFITISDCLVDAVKWICGTGTCASILTNRQFWVSMALLLVSPISFFKTLDALRFTNTLSVFIVYLLAICIILYATNVFNPCDNSKIMSDCRGPTHWFRSYDTTLKTLPVFIFCFTCQQNIFTIVQEIRQRSQKRINSVILLTMITAFALYLTVAIDGYLSFGDKVKGDILLNYPQNLILTILRIFVAVMVRTYLRIVSFLIHSHDFSSHSKMILFFIVDILLLCCFYYR